MREYWLTSEKELGCFNQSSSLLPSPKRTCCCSRLRGALPSFCSSRNSIVAYVPGGRENSHTSPRLLTLQPPSPSPSPCALLLLLLSAPPSLLPSVQSAVTFRRLRPPSAPPPPSSAAAVAAAAVAAALRRRSSGRTIPTPFLSLRSFFSRSEHLSSSDNGLSSSVYPLYSTCLCVHCPGRIISRR